MATAYKYCRFCGKQLVKKEENHGYDPYGGWPLFINFLRCPKYNNRKSCKHTSVQTGEPHA